MDLTGAFLLHTAPNVRKLGPGRYEKLCIRTTTSARMVRFTEGLGSQYGVRAICGKGGFPDEAIEPMQRLGMVYFAIVGGAAALETTQIEEIEEVAWRSSCPSACGSSASRTSAHSRGIDAHGARCIATSRTAPARDWRTSMHAFDENSFLDIPTREGSPASAASRTSWTRA